MAWKPSGGCRMLLCLPLLLLAGCREDEPIRSYKAPREALPEPAATRLLAVMAEREKAVWFFKFIGSKKEVAEHVGDFEAVLHSVRFQDREDAPLTWTDPPGWKRIMGPRPPRYATLRLGRKDEGQEIIITRLGPEAGDVRKNVDRWRDQLGLEPLTEEQFRALSGNSELGGVKATKVDLVGARKEGAAPRMGRAPQQRPKAERLPFQYTAPDGWEVRPAAEKQGVRTPLVFRIQGNGGEAEAAGMALPADGGGLGFNVNRWRRQAGLPPQSDEQIHRAARTLNVGGQEAVYVDISGPGLRTPRRILGAIVPHGGKETWFFTLKGPPDLVGKEQSHFEAFVKSVRFDGEAGAAHE